VPFLLAIPAALLLASIVAAVPALAGRMRPASRRAGKPEPRWQNAGPVPIWERHDWRRRHPGDPEVDRHTTTLSTPARRSSRRCSPTTDRSTPGSTSSRAATSRAIAALVEHGTGRPPHGHERVIDGNAATPPRALPVMWSTAAAAESKLVISVGRTLQRTTAAGASSAEDPRLSATASPSARPRTRTDPAPPRPDARTRSAPHSPSTSGTRRSRRSARHPRPRSRRRGPIRARWCREPRPGCSCRRSNRSRATTVASRTTGSTTRCAVARGAARCRSSSPA
jgi:hypothetical protein